MADSSLTEFHIAEFRQAFSIVDKDSDGAIRMEELEAILKSLNECPTKEEIQEMMKEVDVDGTINFDEFSSFMSNKISVYMKIKNIPTVLMPKKQEKLGEELKEAFNVFDRDEDGFISPIELKNVMIDLGERLTDEEAKQMIREADLDGDGLVSYNEFVRMIMMDSSPT